MRTSTGPDTRLFTIVLGLLALSTLLMWLPALGTPLWGDDYVFLLHAQSAAGTPWWSAFRPDAPVRFWRPLSQEGYWRLMLALTGGSALAMHVASLMLHVLASAGVALAGWRTALACRWPRPGRVAACAGVIYAGLALNMLPVHWASAANSAMLVLFTSLALAAWLAAADAPGPRRIALLLAVALLQALVLLCKESGVLLPVLLVVPSLFAGHRLVRRGEILTLLASLAIIAIWLVLDARFTAHTDQAYGLEVGTNVLRNAAAFVAWLLNVPREAVRMAMLGHYATALAWSAATALPLLLAAWLAGRAQRKLLDGRQWILLALFAGSAYGPYFLFADHSYAYYAAVAAIMPVIVLAALCARHDRLWLVLALIALSSWLSVAGSRHAAQPALLARAHWSQSLLQKLHGQAIHGPLQVIVSKPRRFYAAGRAGLAWRLNLPISDIHVVRQCTAGSTCLFIDKQGQAHLQENPD